MSHLLYIVELTEKELTTLKYLVDSNQVNGELKKKLNSAGWKDRSVFDHAPTKENYPNSRQVKVGLRPIADIEPWSDKEAVPTEKQLKQATQDLEDPMAYSNGHKSSLRFARRMMNLIRKLQAYHGAVGG